VWVSPTFIADRPNRADRAWQSKGVSVAFKVLVKDLVAANNMEMLLEVRALQPLRY
jgi:hypothetical protein